MDVTMAFFCCCWAAKFIFILFPSHYFYSFLMGFEGLPATGTNSLYK